MVVTVQEVGDASKSAQRFESRDNSRFDHVARSRELCGGRSLLAEGIKFRVDGLLEVFGFHPGFGRHLHFKYGTKYQRLLIHRHVLRDLLFVHKLLVQPAGLSPAKNRRRKIRFRISRFENRRSQPPHVHTGKLDVILKHGVTLRCNRRRACLDLRHILAALQRPKIFLHQAARLFRIEVPNNRQARVIWRVIQLEKVPHVLQLCRLNIQVRTDHFAVVRMFLREKLVEEPFFHYAVRSIFEALPPLITHHVLLIRKVRLVQFVRDISHAV